MGRWHSMSSTSPSIIVEFIYPGPLLCLCNVWYSIVRSNKENSVENLSDNETLTRIPPVEVIFPHFYFYGTFSCYLFVAVCTYC